MKHQNLHLNATDMVKIKCKLPMGNASASQDKCKNIRTYFKNLVSPNLL